MEGVGANFPYGLNPYLEKATWFTCPLHAILCDTFRVKGWASFPPGSCLWWIHFGIATRTHFGFSILCGQLLWVGRVPPYNFQQELGSRKRPQIPINSLPRTSLRIELVYQLGPLSLRDFLFGSLTIGYLIKDFRHSLMLTPNLACSWNLHTCLSKHLTLEILVESTYFEAHVYFDTRDASTRILILP